MKEIKVGDYVRSKLGYIGKVCEIFKNTEKKIMYLMDTGTVTDDFVVNSSDKITDLIQVGDYVNGVEVKELAIKMRDEQGVFGYPNFCSSFIEEIAPKSIVTKEQFESMKYEVK